MPKHSKRKIVSTLLVKIDVPSEIDRMEIDPDKILELAESIKEIGLKQPILLRPRKDRFEIVAGHRRFLAHERLGFPVIDSIVEEMTDLEAAIIRATENLSREELTPLEEAAVFQNLIRKHGMKIDQVAVKFGYKPGTIKRRMEINRMPPQLQQAVHKKQISVTVAEMLWPISDLNDLDYYLMFAVENGCTKEVARQWCKDWKDTKRREQSAGGQGGQILSVNEPRPVYVACDLCSGAMEIGKETVMRVCPECFATIKANM